MNPSRVHLVMGPGGVGKTTIAAALGIQLAEQGFRTIVLTVDPARRLAQAMGIEQLGSEIHEVMLKKEEKKSGKLFVTMLDSRRYFDKVIERFATSEKQKEKILSSSLYQGIVDHLGGTHEYAAMERLFEFVESSDYEKIVVDTPPSQNAIDFLTAPERLANFMESSVLKWFQGKAGPFSFFHKGAKLTLALFRKIFGDAFFLSFTDLMNDLEGMQTGFKNRQRAVLNLLRSDQAQFCLVTYPSQLRFQDTVEFARALDAYQLPLTSIVVNRVQSAVPQHLGTPSELNKMLNYFEAIHHNHTAWIIRLREAFPNLSLRVIPEESGPLNDVARLSDIGKNLIF